MFIYICIDLCLFRLVIPPNNKCLTFNVLKYTNVSEMTLNIASLEKSTGREFKKIYFSLEKKKSLLRREQPYR